MAGGITASETAALMLNATKSLDHRVSGAGFRTNSLRYRSSITGETGPRTAETFLLNTQLRRGDRETEASVVSYYEEAVVRMLANDGIESVPSLAMKTVPRAAALPLRLDQCFARRRSQRTFTGDPIQFEQLAALLYAAAGVTANAEARFEGSEEPVVVQFRSAPSPGGLFAIDLYLSIQKVVGLLPGLYKYGPRSARLGMLRGADAVTAVRRAFSFPDELIAISNANVVFVLVLRPQKLMRKYGDRGVRYAFIEAGEITQNVHLAVTSLGFGSVECAGFYDADMLEAFGLDAGTNYVVHTIVVGVPPSG